jgi:hypothetical protein
MTSVPRAVWRIVAGPPGIEIGARLYEPQKSEGRTIVHAIKKRRNFAKQINGLQATATSWSVPANATLDHPIKRAA